MSQPIELRRDEVRGLIDTMGTWADVEQALVDLSDAGLKGEDRVRVRLEWEAGGTITSVCADPIDVRMALDTIRASVKTQLRAKQIEVAA